LVLPAPPDPTPLPPGPMPNSPPPPPPSAGCAPALWPGGSASPPATTGIPPHSSRTNAEEAWDHSCGVHRYVDWEGQLPHPHRHVRQNPPRLRRLPTRGGILYCGVLEVG
ncbi:unnamed protein product, partial [Closterium sp. NIES-53]